MSKYTRSIRTILQQNAGNNDISTISGIYNVASDVLFPTDAINVINQQYRQPLIVGFTLHYLNDEIGLETLPLWRMALSEKLYNYGSYINDIYTNLDKQVFADYRVRNVNASGSNQVIRTGTGTVTDEKDEDTTTNVTDALTHSETIENTVHGTLAGTGTITNAKSGTDTVGHTGTDTNAKSGTDTATHTGTDTSEKTGTDTLAQTGTDENAHTGTQGNVGTSSTDTANTGTVSNDHNVITVNSDTPMGALSNLRTPGGNAKGTGVAYADGQTYNYMSSAGEVDESNVQTDNTLQQVTGSDSSTTTFNDTNTETRNLQDQTTYDTEDTRTLDLTDRNTYNSSDTRTVALEDETTYNSSNLETRNTTDTENKTDNTTKSGSDGKTGETVVDSTVTNTQTRDTEDTENGTHSDTSAETDYTFNWEMLYKSMPLLNKLWDVFDDLFMCIY